MYLLSRTLLLLFPLYLMCFWMKLTRTNAVFSRIALVSSLCAETRLSGKYETNLYKVFFGPEDPRSQEEKCRRPAGGPHLCQARPHPGPRLVGVGPPRVPPGLLLRPEVAL